MRSPRESSGCCSAATTAGASTPIAHCVADTAFAIPADDSTRDPREYCVVVDCGSIRCEHPLSCVDQERGVCAPSLLD